MPSARARLGWRMCCLAIGIIALVVLGATSGGCGEAPAAVSLSSTTTAVPGSSPATTTLASAERSGAGDLTGTFAELATALAPMSVYGLVEAPVGAELAREWWPVTQIANPSDYAGTQRANPHVAGLGSDESQGELLLRMGEGWLDFLENFRGDLGETESTGVGKVAGHVAILCHVNGGTLVQWSDGGRWYGVFGRGVADEVVVDTASAARLVEPNKAE